MNDDIDIQKLADLARLDLADTDEEELKDSISSVLEYVSSVDGAATDDTPEAGPVRNVLREDSDPHEAGAYRQALLREAPNVDDDGFIVVPPILS